MGESVILPANIMYICPNVFFSILGYNIIIKHIYASIGFRGCLGAGDGASCMLVMCSIIEPVHMQDGFFHTVICFIFLALKKR